MNYQKIKDLVNEKKISFKDLCFKIDISEQGLHQAIRKESLKIAYLEKIAKALDVPVSYFFEQDGGAVPGSAAGSSSGGCEKYLKEISELKSRIIDLLDKKIDKYE